MIQKLLTIKDVANTLSIGLSTAYELVREGQLPARRVGSGRGTIRVRPADLERFINQPPEHPPRPELLERL